MRGIRLTDVEKKFVAAFMDGNKLSPKESEEMLRFAKENEEEIR